VTTPPRNFTCPDTEEPCTDPRCRRDMCVARNVAEATAHRQMGLKDALTFISKAELDEVVHKVAIDSLEFAYHRERLAMPKGRDLEEQIRAYRKLPGKEQWLRTEARRRIISGRELSRVLAPELDKLLRSFRERSGQGRPQSSRL
jgi:hypothetical protein